MKENALGHKTFSISRETDHSFEFVATINNVTFINDSKATNARLAVESINSVDAEIVLILGGDDMKTDYSWFTNINYYNIKTVIYFGRRFSEIKNIFNKHVMVIVAENLESSVLLAKSMAIKNQAVLFSPACPSYDPFDNYKNRGNKFKSLVISDKS
ncbi:MAG: UDP-N-acetylmuramoylalanine--D-glutamate ligase [Bacteroidota bacterium]|jgi:UDP-N-acetylmuramoylalanine--D-glutamate ligase|nr:UDP-N-acetylmuramoylalanine--D-glutamate ligase [Bacteroidota bacterium]